MENYIWLIVVAGGALALGAALAFAVLQRRLTAEKSTPRMSKLNGFMTGSEQKQLRKTQYALLFHQPCEQTHLTEKAGAYDGKRKKSAR